MCPACVTSTATLVATALSVGGAATIVAGMLGVRLPSRAATAGPRTTPATPTQETVMLEPRIASREEWVAARRALLEKEKAFG